MQRLVTPLLTGLAIGFLSALLTISGCSEAATRTLTIIQNQSTETYDGAFRIDVSQLPADAIEKQSQTGDPGKPETRLELNMAYEFEVVLRLADKSHTPKSATLPRTPPARAPLKSLAAVALILFVILLLRQLRKPPRRNPLAPQPLENVDTTPDKPHSFGRKMNWLAIRATDPASVIPLLPLRKTQPANWSTGFIAAYGGHTFVSPSVDGWVFVLSHSLPEIAHDRDRWQPLMQSLSTTLDEAQYFGSHRVSGYAAWARWVNGQEVRAFAWCDETLANRGQPTPGEVELNFKFYDENSPEADDEGYWDRTDLCRPGEDHVLQVAGKWSIDPDTLDQRDGPLGCGVIGQLT